MKIFEYTQFTIESDDDIIKILNNFGKLSWECFHIENFGSKKHLFFKRFVQEKVKIGRNPC